MSLTLSLTNSTTFSSVQTPISLALPLISSTSCHSNLITTDQISRWNNEEVIEWISNVQQGLFAQYSFKLQTLNINGEELLNLSIPFMMNELEIKNANHRLTLEAQINRLKNKGYKRKSFKYDSMLPIALPLHSHSKSLGPVTIHSIADNTLSLNHSYSNDVNTHKCKNGNISENKKNKKNKKSKKSRKKWKKMKKMKKNKKNKKLKTVESKVQKTSTIKPSSLSVYYKNESNSNNIQSEMSATQILEQSNTSPGSYEENQWGVSIPDVKKKKKKYYYKELAKQLWPRETAVIVKEGWLRKKGERGGGKFKQRWCELRKNGRFYYFEKRPSFKNSPHGFIDIKKDVLSIEFIEEEDIYTSGFALKTLVRVWIFTCISDESLISWMTSIKVLIANCH